MLGKTKGIAATTIVAILGVAAIPIGVTFAAGEVQTLLEFIVNNWMILFVSALGLGVVLIATVNSFQSNPKWKRDIAGLGLLLGIMLVVPFAWGSVSGTYTADMTVKMDNSIYGDGPGDIRILDVEVSNFDKNGFVGQMQPLSLTNEPTVNWEVFCDGESRNKGSFTIEITEGWSEEKTQKIKNLPEGGNCRVELEAISQDNVKLDEETYSFTVEG